MKKIVSNILIVSTQLIVGGLFLFMLFSDSNEDNRVVVVDNNNLDKMADSVSELFAVDHVVQVDNTAEEELVSAEQKKAEEEALRIAQEEAARKAAEEEALRLAQEEAARKAAEEEAARIAASTACDNSVASLQSYARDLVINTYGWSDADFEALVVLWNRESGWNYSASNGSGAYGIPQALPGSKMAEAGSDYLTNGRTQIRWGLTYIQSKYGTPSAAWGHFQSTGWY